MMRVFVLIALASVVWVPVGVWVGLRPRAPQIVQPVAQFLAAFPANLLFPLAVYGIVTWHLDANVWLSPLMILGTQWYILFNVIVGATRDAERAALRGGEPAGRRLALVAQGRAARRFPLLRDRA